MLAWIIEVLALHVCGKSAGEANATEKDRRPHATEHHTRVPLGQRQRGEATGFTGCLGGFKSIAIGCTTIASNLTANGARAVPKEKDNEL